MGSLNKVFLMGNLTRDPEIRYSQSGMAITNIGLAVNRRVKDNATNQWRDQPDFINVVFFARRGEVVSEYFHKGDPIFVEGRLNYQSWETPAGERRSKLEVVGENFEFISSRGGPGPGQQESPPSSYQGGGPPAHSPSPSQSAPPPSAPSQPPAQPPTQPPQPQQPPSDGPPPYDESSFADDEVPF